MRHMDHSCQLPESGRAVVSVGKSVWFISGHTVLPFFDWICTDTINIIIWIAVSKYKLIFSVLFCWFIKRLVYKMAVNGEKSLLQEVMFYTTNHLKPKDILNLQWSGHKTFLNRLGDDMRGKKNIWTAANINTPGSQDSNRRADFSSVSK